MTDVYTEKNLSFTFNDNHITRSFLLRLFGGVLTLKIMSCAHFHSSRLL